MSPARRRGSPRCAGPRHDVPVVSVALLVRPLEELEAGWTVEVDALLASPVLVTVDACVVVAVSEVVSCGSDLSRGSAPPGRTLSVSREPGR